MFSWKKHPFSNFLSPLSSLSLQKHFYPRRKYFNEICLKDMFITPKTQTHILASLMSNVILVSGQPNANILQQSSKQAGCFFPLLFQHTLLEKCAQFT